MGRIISVLGTAAIALGIIFVITLVLSLPVLWLWNWLCPDLFGLPEITWMQAWGINVLGSFLFGGFWGLLK